MTQSQKTQDFSTTNVDKTTAFIEKNKKILGGVIAGLVVVALGIYCYINYYQAPREEKASYLLARGENYFAAGNYDMALNGDKAEFNGFLSIAQKYSGTKAANLAKLYAGLCYAQKGDAQNAIKYIEDFSTKSDQLVSPASIAALGNCYAKTGNIDKAISLLKKAAEKADNNSLSPIFYIQAGELLENQGKKEEALKLYQIVKSKYALSAEAATIDKYIERASAH